MRQNTGAARGARIAFRLSREIGIGSTKRSKREAIRARVPSSGRQSITNGTGGLSLTQTEESDRMRIRTHLQ